MIYEPFVTLCYFSTKRPQRYWRVRERKSLKEMTTIVRTYAYTTSRKTINGDIGADSRPFTCRTIAGKIDSFHSSKTTYVIGFKSVPPPKKVVTATNGDTTTWIVKSTPAVISAGLSDLTSKVVGVIRL